MDRTRKENAVLYSLIAASATMAVGGLFLQINTTYKQITALGTINVQLPNYAQVFSKKVSVLHGDSFFDQEKALLDKISIAQNEKIKTPKALIKKLKAKSLLSKITTQKLPPPVFAKVVAPVPTEKQEQDDKTKKIELEAQKIREIHSLLQDKLTLAIQTRELDTQKIIQVVGLDEAPFNEPAKVEVNRVDTIVTVQAKTSVKKPANPYSLSEAEYSTIASAFSRPKKVAETKENTQSDSRAKELIEETKVKKVTSAVKVVDKKEQKVVQTQAVLVKQPEAVKEPPKETKVARLVVESKPQIQNQETIESLTEKVKRTIIKTTPTVVEQKVVEYPKTAEITVPKAGVLKERAVVEDAKVAEKPQDVNTQVIAQAVVEAPRDLSTQILPHQVLPEVITPQVAKTSEESKRDTAKESTVAESPVTTQTLVTWVTEKQKEQPKQNNTVAQANINKPEPAPVKPLPPPPAPPQETEQENDRGQSVNYLVTENVKQCDSLNLGVDAFVHYSKQDLIGICRKPISDEGKRSGKQARWWEVKKSTDTEDYWTTLVFQSPSDEGQVEIISENNIRFLSVLAKTDISSKTGIVFGKINKGLAVQLSGRAEQPIYFNELDKPEDNLKHFVFLNVEPGAALLYVYNENGESQGSLPIIVKSNAATFLNINTPKVKKISGSIWAAESGVPKALSGVSVEIIGQNGKKAISNSRGYFEIQNVLQYGKYPVYVDLIKNETSYKHRYRLSEDEDHWIDRPYFYFGEESVSRWLNQLEGAVKENTGIIIGAVAAPEGAQIKVKQIEAKESSKAEIYQINERNELMPTTKTGAGNVRFVVIQVPEGIASVSVDKENGKRAWSASAITQRGVISVVEN